MDKDLERFEANYRRAEAIKTKLERLIDSYGYNHTDANEICKAVNITQFLYTSTHRGAEDGLELLTFVELANKCTSLRVSGCIQEPGEGELKGQTCDITISGDALKKLAYLALKFMSDNDTDIMLLKNGKRKPFPPLLNELPLLSTEQVRTNISALRKQVKPTISERGHLRRFLRDWNMRLLEKGIFGKQISHERALLYDIAVIAGLIGKDESKSKRDKYTFVKNQLNAKE